MRCGLHTFKGCPRRSAPAGSLERRPRRIDQDLPGTKIQLMASAIISVALVVVAMVMVVVDRFGYAPDDVQRKAYNENDYGESYCIHLAMLPEVTAA